MNVVDVTQKERSREFDMVRFKDRGGERRLPGWAPNATEVVIDRVRVGVISLTYISLAIRCRDR